jgi:hypothetical protein
VVLVVLLLRVALIALGILTQGGRLVGSARIAIFAALALIMRRWRR